MGDSLLDYLPESKITKYFYPGKKYYRAVLFDNYDENYPDTELFDIVFGVVESDDKKYIIETLEGFLNFENNFNNCIKKKKIIVNDISELFPDINAKETTKTYLDDKTNKSKIYKTSFLISKQGYIGVSCFDMSKESGKLDSLALYIKTIKFNKYLVNEAYK